MLLRLVPEQPLPTILFTLAFGNLPDGVPFPQNWTAQLQHVLQDELEMPNCIHALDKAAWAACLLHEVTFNVASRSVSCLFVDGTRIEWPLVDAGFKAALQGVLDDVNESSVASEMEQRRTKAIQMAAQAAEAAPSRPATPVSAKGQKHKKSRSLLMTLVASFCPSSQPPSSSLLPIEPRLPIEAPPPEPPQSSRSLRRKARASLVDIYRQYILSVLDSPFSVSRGGGCSGYVIWNLQSILRRIDVRMHELARELGDAAPAGKHRAIRISPSTLTESPFEEDDDSSASGTTEGSTETDASSVHTPRDSYAEYPLVCRGNGTDDKLVDSERGIATPASRLGPSASSSRSSKSGHSQQTKSSTQTSGPLAEYALLHASTIRLRSLIHRAESSAAALAADRESQLAILEAKSRRRAWSSRQLMGGACGDYAALGKPMRGSPLRWAVETLSGVEALKTQTQTQTQTQGRFLGVPRMPGGRLATRRMLSKKIDFEHELTPAMRVPSQAGCVPFPQTEVGDDFCSTGPQDTSPLFGGPVDADSDSEELADSAHGTSKSPAALSSHDLPGLISEAYADAAEEEITYEADSGGFHPPMAPFHTFEDGDAFDPPCDEFAHTLSFEHVKEPKVSRAVRTRANARRRRDMVPIARR